MAQFPTLDLSIFLNGPYPGEKQFPSAAQRAAAQMVDQCFRGIGLLFVKNLALSTETLSDMFDQARKLFQPSESYKKATLRPMLPGTNMGYLPHNVESLNNVRGADIKETFNFRFGVKQRQDFSGTPKGFEKSAQTFWDEMTISARALSMAADVALDMPTGYFESAFARNEFTAVRLLHYPPYVPTDGCNGGNECAAVRAGEHTDFGLFTFLFTDGPGLQARVGDDWVDVPAVPEGTSIVVTGGLMARWTNDRWPAVVHRVIVHKEEDTKRDRMSIASFFQPDPDFVIGPDSKFASDNGIQKYDPITAIDYMEQRLSDANAGISEKAYYGVNSVPNSA